MRRVLLGDCNNDDNNNDDDDHSLPSSVHHSKNNNNNNKNTNINNNHEYHLYPQPNHENNNNDDDNNTEEVVGESDLHHHNQHRHQDTAQSPLLIATNSSSSSSCTNIISIMSSAQPTSAASAPQRTPSFKPSPTQYKVLVAILVGYGLVFGYYAGIQPIDQWRYFSWHPFCMTLGMVTLPGIGAVTKKLGGYTNTKIHGILGGVSIFVSLVGLYVIYQNKNSMNKAHFTTVHAWAGLAVLVNMIGVGLVGGIFLHPDFGLRKTDQTIRLAHKTFSRLVLVAAWMTACYGLYQLVPMAPVKLAIYAAPLVCLVPYTLL